MTNTRILLDEIVGVLASVVISIDITSLVVVEFNAVGIFSVVVESVINFSNPYYKTAGF